jgi:hypothetical protein
MNGETLASQTYVQSQIDNLMNTIIPAQFKSYATVNNANVRANIAFASGIAYDSAANLTTGGGYQITLPNYPADGVAARDTEVIGYGAALAAFDIHDTAVSSSQRYLKVYEASPRVFKIDVGISWSNIGTVGNWGLSWWILAVRS